MWTPSTRCPMQVALALRDALGIKTFVETGTAQGDTAFIAAGHFDSVITMEIHEPAFYVAARHLGRVKDRHGTKIIYMLCADTLEALPKILTPPPPGVVSVPPLNTPVLFWLDAHYSGGPTKIGKTECPVIEEIQMIRRANQKHCIMVDDMQIFCTIGLERDDKMSGWSQRPADWPHVDAIIAAAQAEGPCFCMVKEHILFIVPPEVEKVVKENV